MERVAISSKNINLNWELHKNDPDNWMRIPEFNVLPNNVNLEGFEIPILGLDTKDFQLKVPIFDVVHQIRIEARQRFKSLAELKKNYQIAIYSDEMMFESFQPPPISWNEKVIFAFRYMCFMDSVERSMISYPRYKETSLLNMTHAMSQAIDLLSDKPISENLMQKQRSEFARKGGLAKNLPKAKVKEFVINEWHLHKLEYKNNKSAFTRDYIRRVKNEFLVDVTDKTMREVWLTDTPAASKREG